MDRWTDGWFLICHPKFLWGHKNTRKSYRDVNLPSILKSFIIKEETKIELHILTILPVPSIHPLPPPTHTHICTHTHKIIKILEKVKIQKEEIKIELHYFQVLKSNIHVQLVYLEQFIKF